MQYIVLDMEWNQPWPGSTSARKALPIHGEIMQIGAIRVSDKQEILEEFQVLIQSHFYKKINKMVSSITGIKEQDLKTKGLPFARAMDEFKKWCGEDCVFLTWGFDDIMILRENLAIHNQPSDWVQNWFNAQMIFNAQTDGSNHQKALKTALEIMEIQPTRQAHDALGDAFHTAQICIKLDLSRGVAEYGRAVKEHENGFHGAELPGCLARQVYGGYEDKKVAMDAMSGKENKCPLCSNQMKTGRWRSQAGHRYMAMCTCTEHGKYLVRVRLQTKGDGMIHVSKLIYEKDSEVVKSYEQKKSIHTARHRRGTSKPKTP